MVIPAKKYEQAFEVIPNFPKNEIIAFGFFTGDDFESYKLFCKTTEFYEKYQNKDGNEKLIFKIAYESRLPLALSPFEPLYLSLTPEDGARDSAKIFNEKFEEHKDLIEAKKNSKKEKEE